jgi:hypothetical protein
VPPLRAIHSSWWYDPGTLTAAAVDGLPLLAIVNQKRWPTVQPITKRAAHCSEVSQRLGSSWWLLVSDLDGNSLIQSCPNHTLFQCNEGSKPQW